MKEMFRKPHCAQTPEETERAVAGLADRLEEMDRAEGVFGEVMVGALSDEDLEAVTGGFAPVVPTSYDPSGWYSRRIAEKSAQDVWRE